MQNANRSKPGTAPSKPTKGAGTPPQTDDQSSPPQNAAGASDGSPKSGKPSLAQRMAHMLEHGEPMADADDATPPSGGPDTDGDGATSGKGAKPKKFNELAKAVGVELDELYALEIATAEDGKPVTVQALKDHFAKRSEFSVSQLKWNEDRERQQGELARANTELRELLAAIPRDKLDKSVLERVQAKATENEKRERGRTLTVIPEWRDAATMKQELAGMGEWLEDFGFPSGYLATVVDHRVFKMMRSSWQRDVRIKAFLEQAEKEPTPPVGKSKPSGAAPRKPNNGEARARGRAGLVALLED